MQSFKIILMTSVSKAKIKIKVVGKVKVRNTKKKYNVK